MIRVNEKYTIWLDGPNYFSKNFEIDFHGHQSWFKCCNVSFLINRGYSAWL